MIVAQPTQSTFAQLASDTAVDVRTADQLLIVGASPTTRHHPDPMPAIERYDGAVYRFLRRTRCAWPGTAILILSAEYGLIPADQLIRDDGRRMTRERGAELSSHVSQHLVDWFASASACRAVCVDVTYSALAALAGFQSWCHRHQIVYTELAGWPSERLTQLKTWLLTTEKQER